jgi:hypothetical protein
MLWLKPIHKVRIAMARLRSFSWFLLIAIVLGGIAVQPAAAKPRDMSLYPLRVRILESDTAHASGRANLIDGQEVHGFDFSFRCPIHYMTSVGNQAYAAKWITQGKTLEVVSGTIGDEKHTEVCVFRITLYDYVYHLQNGMLTTLTQEQYKVRTGAALPPPGPVDSDMTHYPIRLSILEINWGPPLNGRRTGTGRGNLVSPAALASVDFTTDCNVVFRVTPAGRYLPGRWTQADSAMAVLLKLGGDSGGSYVCNLKTSLHTDVYVLDASGVVRAVSAEEYRRSILKTAAPAVPATQDGAKPAGETATPASDPGAPRQ